MAKIGPLTYWPKDSKRKAGSQPKVGYGWEKGTRYSEESLRDILGILLPDSPVN
jgi:hypothetical protein